MTNQIKALIIFIAITAFVVGFALNTNKVSPTSEASTLLLAELEQGDDIGRVGDQLGKLTLVNFWATWCAPCRDEMPVFEAMYRLNQQDGFQVIGIAIDSPGLAQPFLDSMDISYPILYAQKTGTELMSQIGNPQGLLPYSLLLDEQGQVIDQVLGKIDEAQIRDWLASHLGKAS